MKEVLSVVIALALAVSIPAVSQDTEMDVQSEIELTRQIIQTQRQAIVTQAMELTAEEGTEFWPLYREFRHEIASVSDRRVDLITDYAEKFDILTDEDAEGMLKEYFSYEKDRIALYEKYGKKFEKILPAKKVMRYFQLENKLDAVINFELASEIPLAE